MKWSQLFSIAGNLLIISGVGILIFTYIPIIFTDVSYRINYESQIQDAVVSIAISVNGKFKAVLNDVKVGATQEEVVALATDTLKGRVDIEGAKKIIFVPDKIINFIL